jgi:hypothetical protein
MTERMNYRITVVYFSYEKEYDCHVYSIHGDWIHLSYGMDEYLIIPIKDAVRIRIVRI